MREPGAPSTELFRRVDLPPVRSIGVLPGVAVMLICLGMATALIAGTGGAAPPARGLALGFAAALALIAVIAALGAVECATLRYTLGRAALEVHSALGRLRLRYDEIDAIQGAAAAGGRLPALWPGAFFGATGREDGRVVVYRATTGDPSTRVVVVGTHRDAVVITPRDPAAFKQALIERARSTPRGVRPTRAIRPSWLDRVAATDVWFRAGCVAAILIGALDLLQQISKGATAPRQSFAAVAVILVNLVLGYTALAGVPAAARILIGTTLCGQILAMLW